MAECNEKPLNTVLEESHKPRLQALGSAGDRSPEKNFLNSDKKPFWFRGSARSLNRIKNPRSPSVGIPSKFLVDSRKGVLTKQSPEKKFIHEIEWFLKLPPSLKYLAPRVFDYCLSPRKPRLELEFYGYPALSDLYLYGDCNRNTWMQVFQALERILEDLGEYTLVPSEPELAVHSMRTMYEDKTRSRLKKVMEDPRFEPFCKDTVNINGKEVPGLERCLESLPLAAERLNLYDLTEFCVIHGDMELGNILYDKRNHIVRLIDPRGKFGDFDIYGDPRYDLAKLCHSLEGDYDFMVRGMFRSQWTSRGFQIKTDLSPRHQIIKDLFHKWMLDRWSETYQQVKFIEGLLFLSMVPLHADRFDAQEAFLAKGLCLFEESAWTSPRASPGGAQQALELAPPP